MQNLENLNPLALSCPNCGAPAEYDIAQRSCRCKYCGNLSQPEEQLGLVEHWRSVHREQLRSNPIPLKAALLFCPNCGAEVAVDEGEATGGCAFCGGKLVRKEFTRQEELPDLILPFQLTLDQAKAALKSWAKKQRGKNRKKVEQNIQHLKGYYLPYVFVRGSIDCEVSRDRSDRKFHCSGYVDKIAVNTSKQLRNDVLDAVEPFRWEESRSFAYEYISGQRVKLRDIGDQELTNRVRSEVETDFLPSVEKAMETRGVNLRMSSGALVQMPLLLPIYFISQKGLCVAVNGQTGAVSGWFGETKDTNRLWFIEPALTTLALGLLAGVLSRTVMMGLMFATVVGLISFVAFGQDKDRHIRDVIRRFGKGSRPAQVAPVFRELVNGQWVNVKVSFFPLLRVIRFLVMGILFNVLPLLLALLLCPEGKSVKIAYLSIWLVISIPMTFIFWIAYLRRDIYDFPVFHQIMPNGSLRRVKPASDAPKKSIGVTIGEVLKDLRPDGEGCLFGCLLFGLPVVMFIMSIVCMLD